MLTAEQMAFLRRHLPGGEPAEWQVSLAGAAGSQRRFLRLQRGDQRRILMLWDSADPDWARCLDIDQAATHLQLLPRLFAADAEAGLILEEDLGSLTLKDAVTTRPALPLYRQAIDVLLRWQALDPAGAPVLTARVMDADHLRWESRYFAEHCLAGHFDRAELITKPLNRELDCLADKADAIPKVWIHRDFQSENLMVTPSGIRLVDYQGARLGPRPYDLASLLYDPYVPQLNDDHRAVLCQQIPEALQLGDCDRSFYICACQRLMQALGAYGKLAREDGKRHYLQYIPLAIRRLHAVARQLGTVPELVRVVASCQALNHPATPDASCCQSDM